MVTPAMCVSTYCVEVCGERFNGRLEAFYCFQSVLEKTGGKKEQRPGITREKTIQGKVPGQDATPGGTEICTTHQNQKMTKL